MTEKTKYYYYRDDDNRPVITVCLLQANGDTARGWTLCSELDNPCKKTGRKISRDRAIHAMKTKENSCPVQTDRMPTRFSGRTGIFGWYKSAYNPPLTQLETKLVYGGRL